MSDESKRQTQERVLISVPTTEACTSCDATFSGVAKGTAPARPAPTPQQRPAQMKATGTDDGVGFGDDKIPF